MKLIRWCYEHRLILIINFICFILYVLFSLFFSSCVKKAYDQQEGMRFAAGDVSYHQVSAFWPADTKMGRGDISAVRASLARSLNEASFIQEDVNGKLWTDAFTASATGDLTRLSEVGQTGKEGVVIMGVGGDFFLFHPMELITGSPFFDQQINDDLVFIDDKTAWALYGSCDIAGQRLYVDQRPFVISGVYRSPEDKLSLKA
ncbi:MAG: ABC transporter permease, partial [Lachnospiraceae bacterium]|nr:ABC transporter permease [Lachnospiraceae bacterium]